jgi:translation elongation factor EF-1alpha
VETGSSASSPLNKAEVSAVLASTGSSAVLAGTVALVDEAVGGVGGHSMANSWLKWLQAQGDQLLIMLTKMDESAYRAEKYSTVVLRK